MHVCSCGKVYKRLKPFQEHRALCEMLRDGRKDISDDLSTPSMREMWLALKALIKKNEKLEKQVNELKIIANKQRKNIPIKEWLNENKKLEIECSDWLKDLILNEDDLNKVLKNGFIKGIVEVVIEKLGDKEESVITGYEHKKNILYAYDGGVWRELMNKDLINIVSNFQKKVEKEFKKYNLKYADKYAEHSESNELYENIRKVMVSEKFIEESIKKIKPGIYTGVKQKLNNVVEYSVS